MTVLIGDVLWQCRAEQFFLDVADDGYVVASSHEIPSAEVEELKRHSRCGAWHVCGVNDCLGECVAAGCSCSRSINPTARDAFLSPFLMALAAGRRVELHGLASAELNGAVGTLQAFHEERGRWAVLFLAGPKLLKPENLQVLEGAVVELLGEDVFLRLCHFLGTATTVATSVCSRGLRALLFGSVSLWQSLCHHLLDEAVIALHQQAAEDGSSEFWRALCRAASQANTFFYEHTLREQCLQRSECFSQALRNAPGPGLQLLDGAAYHEQLQRVLGSSGHSATPLGGFVVVVGGWRPWYPADGLHISLLDLRRLQISEPQSRGAAPCRRLRHASCCVSLEGGRRVLMLGGCNDRSHNPCEGLQTLWLLELNEGEEGEVSVAWTKEDATGPVPKAIWHHVADSFAGGKKVVVFGGDIPVRDPEFTFIGDRSYANYVYLLDVDARSWERVQTHGQVPTWRSLHCGGTFSSEAGEAFVVVGGCEDHLEIFHGGPPTSMLAHSLNLKTMKWRRGHETTQVEGRREPLFLPRPRMRFGVQRYGRRLLIYGGHGAEVEEEMLLLDMASLEWSRASMLNKASEYGVAPAAALGGACVVGGVELGPRGVCYASLGSGLLRFDFSLLELLLAEGVKVTAVHLVDSQYQSDAQGYLRHKVALAQFGAWFSSQGVEVYAHTSLERFAFEARRTSALPVAVLQVDCSELTAVFEKEVKPMLEEVLQYDGLYCALTSREGASGAGSLGSSDAWAEARVVATLTEATPGDWTDQPFVELRSSILWPLRFHDEKSYLVRLVAPEPLWLAAPLQGLAGLQVVPEAARRLRDWRLVCGLECDSLQAGGGGILKFYSDDTPGLKVGPTTVLVLSLVFMAIVCSLHILGKFRSG
ncbi:unnamed protein product [Effrenium voratum]|nr:unnamed protein product [Effrenium voratum]